MKDLVVYFVSVTVESRGKGKTFVDVLLQRLLSNVVFVVYYRRTTGDCERILNYDGTEEKLLNVDRWKAICSSPSSVPLPTLDDRRTKSSAFFR